MKKLCNFRDGAEKKPKHEGTKGRESTKRKQDIFALFSCLRTFRVFVMKELCNFTDRAERQLNHEGTGGIERTK
jgi:hypothetical protein